VRVRVSDCGATFAAKWHIAGKLVVPVDLAKSGPTQEHGAFSKWPEGQPTFVDIMMAKDAHQPKLRVGISSVSERFPSCGSAVEGLWRLRGQAKTLVIQAGRPALSVEDLVIGLDVDAPGPILMTRDARCRHLEAPVAESEIAKARHSFSPAPLCPM